ncbi:hypothetical protein [Haloplasma contractile]|uniref:Leucine-rich repeat domain-containing protein n=1 Tax=Haloplasma contractile SSD-17B TaxID=1033810 RepID=F7PSC8_9MOLU|nr:hypothetical protein [Haloplasma contractile]ERJ11047.1 hypothetical protein HLPCO_002938 [Haloplasma contractile SSD-17B]
MKDKIANIKAYEFGHILNYRGAITNKEALIIKEGKTTDYVEIINEYKIEQLRIYFDLLEDNSLDFILQCPTLQYLCIIGDVDFSPLYSAKKIKYLSINSNNPIELEKISGLNSLRINHIDSVRNIGKVNLKSLSLYKYTEKDLKKISKLYTLDTLEIWQGNLESLVGIEHLTNLKVVVLGYLKKLKDISAITGVKGTLKHLTIEECKKLQNHEGLEKLSNLIYFKYDGSYPLENINFVEGMNSLKSLFLIDSIILDGDCTLGLKSNFYVVSPVKKHYYIRSRNNEKMKFKWEELPRKRPINYGNDEIELWRRIDV